MLVLYVCETAGPRRRSHLAFIASRAQSDELKLLLSQIWQRRGRSVSASRLPSNANNAIAAGVHLAERSGNSAALSNSGKAQVEGVRCDFHRHGIYQRRCDTGGYNDVR